MRASADPGTLSDRWTVRVRLSCMPDSLDTLILDLLEWIGSRPRTYAEVMDAWRTSCPRFPVWEDANDRGFIGCHRQGGESFVSVSALGREFLDAQRPRHAAR